MSSSKSDGVKNAVAKGSAISGAVTVSLRIVNFLGALYLLRVLEPNDFGVVALAMLLVGALNLFSDLGMGAALIYSNHDRRTVAFQAFVLSTAFSAILSSIILFNAEFFASFLGAPDDISPVLSCMALYLFISTASTIPFCSLRKDMLFKQIGYITFFSEITVTFVQLALAFLGFGLWSLVFGRLAGAIARTALAWWHCTDRYWLQPGRWNWSVQRDLLGFGFQSTGSGIVAYAYSNFDDWIIGRALGTTALGFYSKAYELTHGTTNRISRNIIRVVFFPAYARVAGDKVRLTRAYVKSLSFVLIIMTPLAFGMLVLASDLVRVLFGEKWLPMVPVMQIYAAVLLTRPVSENSAPLFQALGKPGFNLRAGLLVLIILAPLSLLMVSDGIVGVALAVAIAHFAGMTFNVYQVNTLLSGTAGSSVKLMLLTFFSGLFMAAVLVASKHMISDGGTRLIGVSELVLLIALGTLIYGSSIFLTQRAFVTEIFALVFAMVGRKAKRNTKESPN